MTPRRLLLASLVGILVILVAKALVGTVLIAPRFGVDVEIPLRAAERWIAGQPPYLASAFTSPPGATQPFLYPPYVLPIFALLTNVPRLVLDVMAFALMLVMAVLACRRLAIPWVWLPLALAWPPFAEPIFGGNVQVLLFAAFVFLFLRPGSENWLSVNRDVADPRKSSVLIGGLATVVGAIKVSQLQPWIYLLRRRPRAALGGALGIVVVAAASLIFTGIGPWFDWVAQLRLAADPTWDLGGFALPRFLPSGIGLLIAAACLVAVWFAPRRNAGAWVGLLSVVGSLSLHIFGLLFLVPAMLVIRREVALVAAICIATYSYQGAWAGIALVVVAFVYDIYLNRGSVRFATGTTELSGN
jgi:Glycosyltransferase family 87